MPKCSISYRMELTRHKRVREFIIQGQQVIRHFAENTGACTASEMTSGNILTTLVFSNSTDFYLLIKFATKIPNRFLDIDYHQLDQVSSSGNSIIIFPALAAYKLPISSLPGQFSALFV